MTLLYSDDEVGKAIDWLRDSAVRLGDCRREAEASDQRIKYIKASEMQKHPDLGVAAQEREALASERYLEATLDAAHAAGELEKVRALREAAVLKIEVWRSMSANDRASGMR